MNIDELIETCAAELRDPIVAIQQPRTNFQIAHFVVGQHDTDARRWMQCVLELQIKLQLLRRARVQQRMTRRKIESLKLAGDSGSLDEAELLEIELETHALAIVGAARETQALFAIFKAFPRTYTNEELNAAEEDYWQHRLTRQAKHSLVASGRIGVGDLDALSQIGRPVNAELIRKLEFDLCQSSKLNCSAGPLSLIDPMPRT